MQIDAFVYFSIPHCFQACCHFVSVKNRGAGGGTQQVFSSWIRPTGCQMINPATQATAKLKAICICCHLTQTKGMSEAATTNISWLETKNLEKRIEKGGVGEGAMELPAWPV